MPQALLRRICHVLNVTRSTVYWVESKEVSTKEVEAASQPSQDDVLVTRIKPLIEEFPTYGYRRICVLLERLTSAISATSIASKKTYGRSPSILAIR